MHSVTTAPDELFREPWLAICERPIFNRALISDPDHAGKRTNLVRFSAFLVLLRRFVVGVQGIIPARGWFQEEGRAKENQPLALRAQEPFSLRSRWWVVGCA